ncbi:MAG: hypothetical protein M1479_07835, partial [Actinobacteria bacterium]|nr:hypothetical protein [Actinomycetota bacterium]
MNSRERILSVFKCEMPDKIPVSLNTLSTGFIRANDNLAYDLIKHTDPNIWVYLDLNFLGFEIIFGKNIYENSKIEKDKNTTKITIHTPKGDLVQVTEHRPESDWVTEYFFKDIEDVNKFYSFEYIPFKKDEIDISEYLYWDKIIGNQGIVSVVIYDAPIMLYSLLGPKNYYFSLKDNFKLVKEFTAEAEIRIENFINTLFFL